MHDLRHSFASFAVETGESLYVLQRALGHKKAVTTQRYAHLRDDPLLEMVERVGAFIESAREAPKRSKSPSSQP
jgi:site-specific recombinase XerD